jgi:hypothetical protein
MKSDAAIISLLGNVDPNCQLLESDIRYLYYFLDSVSLTTFIFKY